MAQQYEIRIAPLFSGSFIASYITTMRPYLLFVSGITVAAGLSTESAGWWPSILVVLAGFLSYGFGQALTDCFQTDTDSLSSPYRPLVRGVISKSQVLTVSLIGLSAVGLGLAAGNIHNLWLAAIGAAGLATYTPFKRRWVSGPFYNAWIVALLCYIGMASGTRENAFPEMTTMRWLMLAATFFGYANFVLAGYFKDISADRATGYVTLPVRFGRRAAAIVSDMFATGAIAACAAALIDHGITRSSLPAVGIFAAAVIVSGRAQVLLHGVRFDSEAHHSIALTVHSYILLLSALAVLQQPAWTLPLAVYFAAYLLVLRSRPSSEQV
jgi:4-hydroxybenzoate polyprenyltransferase